MVFRDSLSMDTEEEEKPYLRDVVLSTGKQTSSVGKQSQSGELHNQSPLASDEEDDNKDREQEVPSSSDFSPITYTKEGKSDHGSTGSSHLEVLRMRPDYVPGQKLYGREPQLEKLHGAYRRLIQPATGHKMEFILIHGPSGSGKTRLAETLKHCAKESVNPIICTGKFDQMKLGDPFGAFAAAMADFVAQVERSGDKLIQAYRKKIVDAIESDLPTLLNMLPCFSRVVGESQVLEPTVSETARNSEYLLIKLMRALCSQERPLVLILDDVQWACDSFLNQLKRMIEDTKNHGVVFVGICRDDFASTSRLSSFLCAIEDDDVHIVDIPLQNLERDIVAEIVWDAFRLPPRASGAFADFLYKKTDGSPFYITELLSFLSGSESSGMFQYDSSTCQWRVDPKVFFDSDSSSSLIEHKLRHLPKGMQKVLTVVACLGNRADAFLIEHALKEDISENLQNCVEKELLIQDENLEQYSFRHDRVQMAAYSLLPEPVIPAYHYEIGRRLFESLPDEQIDQYDLIIISQFQLGQAVLTERSIRVRVASLCVRAAEKATKSSSIHGASDYLNFALDILGGDLWADDTYDISLVLLKYAAEVEFSVKDSPKVDEYLDKIFQNARTFDDQLGAYASKIYVLAARNQIRRAIDVGLGVLSNLGINIPRQGGSRASLRWKMWKIGRNLRGKTVQRVTRYPTMTNPKQLACMQILNMLLLNTFVVDRFLFPFVVTEMMSLTVLGGLCAISPVAFAGYGTILCSTSRVKEGVHFGNVALALLEESNTQAYLPRSYAFLWGIIFPFVRPWDDVLEPLQRGHRIGLQTGDILFANFNAFNHIMISLDIGKADLYDILMMLRKLHDMGVMHGHTSGLGLESIMLCFESCYKPDQDLLDHSHLEPGLQRAIEEGNMYALEVVATSKAYLYFMAGHYQESLQAADLKGPWKARKGAFMHECFDFTLEAVCAYSLARKRNIPTTQRRDHIRRGRSRLNFIRQRAKTCPYHCSVKLAILEAEDAAVLGKFSLAKEKYVHAERLGAKYGCGLELVWCATTFGYHHIYDMKDIETGIKYLQKACRVYEKWKCIPGSRYLQRDIDRIMQSGDAQL